MKYKSLIVAVILILLNVSTLKAQLELSAFGGYVIKSTFNVTGGKASILGSPVYGFNISFPLKYYDGFVEFTYQRQETKISVDANDESGNPYKDTLSVGINYFLVSGIYEEYASKSKVIPYGGIQVGLGTLTDKGVNQTIVPFSFGFKGGLKFWPGKRIGIRLESNLNLMVLFQASGFGCVVATNNNSGCGFAITSSSSFGQLGFTGGLIYKIQNKKPETKTDVGL